MGGRNVFVDDEGEMERRENEDDEDEEALNEFEDYGFIVDDVEEEGHMLRRKKKKKREIEENYELDQDDYDLLRDNNVTKPGSKFKRLKKAGWDFETMERSGFSSKEFGRNSHGGQSTAQEKLKRSLFGDDEGAPFDDIAEDQLEEEEEDDDDMADFIVDEEDANEHDAVTKKKKFNKKKLRQAPAVSSSALQEVHEMLGDVDEFLMLHKQGIVDVASGFGERRLEDEFEPFILSEKYTTPKDDAIRETDVPERIQLSEDVTGHPPTDPESVEEETVWIHNQLLAAAGIPPHNELLASGCVPPQIAQLQMVKDGEIDKEDIRRVLTMNHKERFDLPFIAMYRREFCLSLLKDSDDLSEGGEQTSRIRWHKLLWTVHYLDRKWLLLQKRKRALQMYYNKRFDAESRRVDDETRLALNQQIFYSISEALKNSNYEREIDDVDVKFNLHFPPNEVEEGGQFRRPKKKSYYNVCYMAGLWEVANKLGYSSEQFGSNLIKEKMSLDLEDGKETPEEVASNFTCAMFETPTDVLKAARQMAAVEIGCEPSVKKHVCSIFMNNAVVSTSPTPQGNLMIDAHHEFAGVKWLRNKPLSKFVDAQWLFIQKAEEEKLLQVTIKLPETVQNKLLSDAKENYLSDCVFKSAQLWNEERKKILEDAFSNHIFPLMEKVAGTFLTARAKSWLLMEYGSHLWSKVSVAPCKKKETNDDTEDESELRVLACCWGSGRPATTFVMLDSAGEVVDVLYAGSINVRSRAVADQQRKKVDQQRLLKFMTDHQPHVVVLGAGNLSCRPLKDDIHEIIFKIVEDHPRDVSQEMSIDIYFGDESLPHIYESSRISSDQLPAQPEEDPEELVEEEYLVELTERYLANVALKINVKVGGRNTVLVDAISRRIPLVSDRPTIIFGADVTHPHPGEDSSPSIAAVVASQDWPEITKYAGLVCAQAHRQELIDDLFKVWQDPQRGQVSGGMVKELLISFKKATGQKPQRIIFYRDGVSEGQFYQVLLHELNAIRRACASLEPNYQPPVTFVVVQKRHHTRLFANNHADQHSVDRSGNILPGTVVDSKICHPTEFDFYLCSHAGIQGTSRPAHYHVLWDENKFTADTLQTLTNNLCYTYARCTRSVSIVPPAYYAHLAAFRARFYMEPDTSDSGSMATPAAGRGPPGAQPRPTRVPGAGNVKPLPALKDNVKKVMFYC